MEGKFLKGSNVMAALGYTDRASFWEFLRAEGVPPILLNSRRIILEELGSVVSAGVDLELIAVGEHVKSIEVRGAMRHQRAGAIIANHDANTALARQVTALRAGLTDAAPLHSALTHE